MYRQAAEKRVTQWERQSSEGDHRQSESLRGKEVMGITGRVTERQGSERLCEVEGAEETDRKHRVPGNDTHSRMTLPEKLISRNLKKIKEILSQAWSLCTYKILY